MKAKKKAAPKKKAPAKHAATIAELTAEVERLRALIKEKQQLEADLGAVPEADLQFIDSADIELLEDL